MSGRYLMVRGLVLLVTGMVLAGVGLNPWFRVPFRPPLLALGYLMFMVGVVIELAGLWRKARETRESSGGR